MHQSHFLFSTVHVWQPNTIDKCVRAMFHVKHQCIKRYNQSSAIMSGKNKSSFMVAAVSNQMINSANTAHPCLHILFLSKDLITMAHLDSAIPAQCNQMLVCSENADMLKSERMTLRMRDEQDDRGLCETIKSRPSKNQDGLMSPLSGDGRQPASAEVSAEGYLLEEMMH